MAQGVEKVNPSSENERVAVPKWLWWLIGAVFLILLGGTVTAAQWVASSLIDHESRLSVNESDKQNTRQSLQRIEDKLDRLIEKR